MTRTLDELAAFYRDTLAAHHSGPRAVGWNSHVQKSCFAMLAATDGLVPGARVLDVGCGLGDFKGFLDARGLEVDYTGYDICADYVERARQAYPGARFEVRDIAAAPPDERFDVVVASGAMNLRVENHDDFVVALIDAMYAATDHALAFNILSAPFAENRLHMADSDYYYAYPAAMLALCMARTPRVILDHNEQATMFTVYMYRDARASLERLLALYAPGPDWSDAHEAVVDHCLAHGMPARAMEFLRALPPSARALDAMGRVAFDLGDEALQLDCWQRALALAPDDADLAERVELLRRFS